MIKKAMRFGAYGVSAASLMVGSMAAAHAELPAAISTAVETAKTDIGAAGALILGVVVTIAAVAWVRRVVR